MADVIPYDATTRNQFDAETQAILDLIHKRFPLVEIEFPVSGKSRQWFVQVYRNGSNRMPEGFFGDTTLQAAARVAKALNIELDV